MRIEFSQRPLLEICIKKEDHNQKEVEKMVSWLASNATATHRDPNILDFFLWVPPYKNSEQYIKRAYGDDIPLFILQIIQGAIEVRRNTKDQGYLIIALI